MKKRAKKRLNLTSIFIIAVFVLLAWSLARMDRPTQISPLRESPAPVVRAGDIMSIDSTQAFPAQAATLLAKQNYSSYTPVITTEVTKVTFRYRSKLPTGAWTTIHGRAYVPLNGQSDLPIYAFAPGTTGIGDQCAASLEDIKKANWGNYDSHLVTYASQGLAVVTTDYEGMRDDSRIHHYMVGELEGRALLDAVRALQQLPIAKSRLSATNLFVGGYSQGGHAAFWADKVAAEYAPELKITGVVGYGPVMSVQQTLADVTRGANINWFGPYVVYSYRDHFRSDYAIDTMLTAPVAANLNKDVLAHCIDTNIAHWGHNPAAVYTPEFLRVLADGTWEASPYAAFGRQLAANAIGTVATASAKRLNIGGLDNVVLPAQQLAAATELCTSSLGLVQGVVYPRATHYDTMAQSLADTLAWMRTLSAGQSVTSTCPAQP